MSFAKWFGGRATAREEDEPARHPPAQIVGKPAHTAATPMTKPAKRSPKNGFDPYNSGAFERRNAWERINRR